LNPKISLISSKEGMLPGGGIRPPLMAMSESYKCDHRYYLSANKKNINDTAKETSEKIDIISRITSSTLWLVIIKELKR